MSKGSSTPLLLALLAGGGAVGFWYANSCRGFMADTITLPAFPFCGAAPTPGSGGGTGTGGAGGGGTGGAKLAIPRQTVGPLTVGYATSHSWRASGGTPPYTWAATRLPAGIGLSSGGVMSGTPTKAGSYTVTVTVTDAKGTKATRVTALPVRAASGTTTTSGTPPPSTTAALAVPTQPLGTLRQGTAYSHQWAATGGKTPVTWTASGLPPGLTLTAGGLMEGTPTTAGSYTLVVTATDSAGHRSSRKTTVVVARPVVSGSSSQSTPTSASGSASGANTTASTAASSGPLRILPTSHSATYTNANVQLQATGGTPPYRWSATNLPFQIILDPTTGHLGGNFFVSVTIHKLTSKVAVRDAAGHTATATLTWNNFGSFGWQVVVTTGSAAATTTSTTSTPTSTTSTGGTSTSTPSTPPLVIPVQAFGTLRVGTPFTHLWYATGGRSPVRWSAAGLPPGMTFSSGGLLSGTPTQAGTYTLRVIATDVTGQETARTTTLTVAAAPVTTPTTTSSPVPVRYPVSIPVQALGHLTLGQAFGRQMVATGGRGALTWTATGLPPGVTISSTGYLSGTPTQAGSYTVVFHAEDAYGDGAGRKTSLAVVARGAA